MTPTRENIFMQCRGPFVVPALAGRDRLKAVLQTI